MRFVLCCLLALVLPGSALAADRTMTLSQARLAAAKGDSNAAAAVATTVDRGTCLSGCANRGHAKAECIAACRPALCHPDAETPYCIAR